MFVGCIDKIKATDMGSDEAKNVLKRVLIGPKEGWESHVMRLFTVGKDGFTPKHRHPWPHINYVVEGEGVLYLDGKEYKLSKNCVAFVPANALHQYRNTGEKELLIICIVPTEGEPSCRE